MCKRILLLGIICLALTSSSFADNGKKAATKTAAKKVKTSSSNRSNSQNFTALYAVNHSEGDNGTKLNPRAISFVQDYIAKNREDLEDMKTWCTPYFNLINGILVQYGLPTELKYLAVIESQLKPTSVSHVGAVGPWQLMPETARLLGLKVSARNDERKSYTKSTRAAARYLKDLYVEFGDWLLVIAAYNGGSANVYKAIKKSHSRNFWDLQYYLPTESRNHVKKFIATHYVFEGQGSVTTLTREEAKKQLSATATYVSSRKLNREELDNAKTITISGKYYGPVIAKYTLLSMDEFNRYNPEFDRMMASSSNNYDLKLPADKSELFAANKYQILNESVEALLNDESTAQVVARMNKEMARKEEE